MINKYPLPLLRESNSWFGNSLYIIFYFNVFGNINLNTVKMSQKNKIFHFAVVFGCDTPLGYWSGLLRSYEL